MEGGLRASRSGGEEGRDGVASGDASKSNAVPFLSIVKGVAERDNLNFNSSFMASDRER